MRVAVLCECSGVVRDAFLSRGHDAVSCDLKASEVDGPHIHGDCLRQDWSGFDLLICHPPCTYLTVTGNKWMKPEFRERFPTRERDREVAVAFFLAMTRLPVRRIAIENPVGIMSRLYRKPDQIIEPWHFGDRATKKTCLWLKGLPPLLSLGGVVAGRGERTVYKSGKSHAKWYADAVRLKGEARAAARSRTFIGIAAAMATQWGVL